MVYKKYYSPFENAGYVKEEKNEPSEAPPKIKKSEEKNESSSPLEFLSRINTDDILLIGILIILLSEAKEERDVPLILAISYLFLIQYIEN